MVVKWLQKRNSSHGKLFRKDTKKGTVKYEKQLTN